MKIIGLTGGIGSGKSSVARVFETLGIPVFHADDFGKHVLTTDPHVVEAVTQLLGHAAYKNGQPDRAAIAAIVFSDPEKLAALNAIVHPAVARAFLRWQNEQDPSSPYCIRESAILFESGANKDCDKVICVTAPDEVRIARVMERDAATREQVMQRMARQMPQSEKENISDVVMLNDGEVAVIPQVVRIHNAFNEAAIR